MHCVSIGRVIVCAPLSIKPSTLFGQDKLSQQHLDGCRLVSGMGPGLQH
jgi:hypothetical protein